MATKPLCIDQQDLTLDVLETFLREHPAVELGAAAIQKINEGHKVIQKIVKSGKVVYGVNTGFGKFADVNIPKEQTKELQSRLVLSHAAGIGDPFENDIVRLMMLLKVKNLSQGHSGVRLKVVQQLVDILNSNIVPVVPEKGSVGASGDLAPLAHMAITMIGEGESFLVAKGKRKKVPSKEALKQAGIEPLTLMEKEGLAILNGTQAIQACGCLALINMRNLVKTADVIGAISLEALLGSLTPFDARIQAIRGHPGQIKVAENFHKVLHKSPMVESHKYSTHRIQDAYCLRCIPQVHGAVRDGLEYVESVYCREINGVTDNPMIFPDNGDVLSGGNFHGEPVAISADYLGIIAAELANISERRIEHMMDSSISELAGFLTKEGGLNSGFMIAQVSAAALVSENKVLAHPASVDSIPTSANKEDHVSMGTLAARKALQIINNAEYVLAIELMCACQALDLRAPIEPSVVTKAVLKHVRKFIKHWDEDRYMNPDIAQAYQLIAGLSIKNIAEEKAGKLN